MNHILKSPLSFQLVMDRLNRLEHAVSHLETAVDVLLEAPSDFKAAFNRQDGRRKIFHQLLSAFQAQLIVETGTYMGSTTGYMAETTKLPIISTEIKLRFHLIAKKRLEGLANVRLENLDSRQLIKNLAADPKCAQEHTFFYLDAHWYDDLPLKEEIEIVARNWRQFIIMVDDFNVPDDPGYGYDDYGEGKVLTLEYIEPLLKRYELVAFFPFVPSSQETGYKRGCIVLTNSLLAEKLEHVKSLIRLKPR